MYHIVSTIVFSKIISTSSPYLFKRAIDSDSKTEQSFLYIGSFYVSRFMSGYLNELRNVIVNKASFIYTNDFCFRVIKHKKIIDAVFMKKLERARKGHKSLFTIKYTHIIPTGIELSMGSALIVTQMSPLFSGILLSTIGYYIYRSIKITDKRIEERKILNSSENMLYNSSKDNLPKIFKQLSINEEKLIESLKNINVEQQMILVSGNITMALLWYQTPSLNISDFVMLNMISMQVYQPLNQAGMIYREWNQSKYDIKEVSNYQ